MIIDCHGHYTTAPKALEEFRKRQIDDLKHPSSSPAKDSLHISDDQLRESLEGAQLRLQRDRGTDLTVFSPRAGGMGHHRQRRHQRAVVGTVQRTDTPHLRPVS